MAGVTTGKVPTAGIFGVDGTTFVVGVDGGVLTIVMRDTHELDAVSLLEAGAVYIGLIAFVHIADEKLKVAIMVGVNFCGEVDDGGGLPVGDDGDVVIGHEIASDHVVDTAFGITAEACAIGKVEVFDGFVDLPAGGGEIGLDGCDCAAVETVSAVVDNWIGDDVEIVAAFGGFVGCALAGGAHHAVSVGCGE